jgi:hypothetical protein
MGKLMHTLSYRPLMAFCQAYRDEIAIYEEKDSDSVLEWVFIKKHLTGCKNILQLGFSNPYTYDFIDNLQDLLDAETDADLKTEYECAMRIINRLIHVRLIGR